LYFNKTIRKITAAILLLLFALSVTPKQLLHDAITGHKHTQVKYNGTVNFLAAKKSFQCNWDNDAVESPFTYQPDLQPDLSLPAYSSHVNYYSCNYYSAEYFFSPLRGPPSLV
jgi:hypothetical protein